MSGWSMHAVRSKRTCYLDNTMLQHSANGGLSALCANVFMHYYKPYV